MERDGILRARSPRRGGPYRLLSCPDCQRTNMCEKTRRGHWFSSPDFRPHLLDWLIGKLLAADPVDFLRAVAWHRENEERRRYYFERDGDLRYSSVPLRWARWVGGDDSPETIGSTEHGRSGSSTSGRRDQSRESAGSDRRRERPRRRVTPVVPSPWDILGVPPTAGPREIRGAFHRLAVQYHPDKVHHLGEEFQRIANEKFKELQVAYDALLRRQRSGDSGDDTPREDREGDS